MAGELWPPVRLEILGDPALDEIWIKFPNLGKPSSGKMN